MLYADFSGFCVFVSVFFVTCLVGFFIFRGLSR